MMLMPFIAFTVLLLGQSPTQSKHTADISTLLRAGKITDSQYENTFFYLTVDAPHAEIKLAPVVDSPDQRARLVQLFGNSPNWEEKYTFALLADTLSRYPQLHSPAQYVLSVRHQLERQEKLTTVRDEFPITVSGVAFTGAIMQEQNLGGKKYFRGIYTTFRAGFILSFDLEAPSETRINELVTSLVHFRSTSQK